MNLSVTLLEIDSSCEYDDACSSGYCVHGVCRDSDPYCGDGYCDDGEACSNCSDDCGSCPEQETSSFSGGGSSGGGSFVTICEPNWTCSEWSECVDDKQTRVCTDENSCGDESDKPAEEQECTLDGSNTSKGAGTETINETAENSTDGETIENEISGSTPLIGAGITGLVLDGIGQPITIAGIVVVVLLIIAFVVWKKFYKPSFESERRVKKTKK